MSIVVSPPSPTELSAMPLLTDTQYLEEMGSVSFNRKFCGIIPAGIYRGFEYEVFGPTTLRICPTNPNTAAVERDGQVINVTGQKPIDVVIPRSQAVAVVIEAISQHGLITKQIDKNSSVDAASIKVVPVGSVASHHVIICTVNLPAAGALNSSHISRESRKVGGDLNKPTFEQAYDLFAPKGDYVTAGQVNLKQYGVEQFKLKERGTPLKAGDTFTPDNSTENAIYPFPTSPKDGDLIEWKPSATPFSSRMMTLTPTDKNVEGSMTAIDITEDGICGGFVFRAEENQWRAYITGAFTAQVSGNPGAVYGMYAYPSAKNDVTLSRVAKFGELAVITSAGNVQITLDTTFQNDDRVTLDKPLIANRMTIQAAMPIILPDGTTDLSPFIDGSVGQLKLILCDGSWYLQI